MPGHRLCIAGRFAMALLITALLSPILQAADKEPPKAGTVDGIVLDKGDKFITVRKDGDAEPVKYVYDDKSVDKQSLEALNKTIFTVGRVRLKYKLDGDTRQLVSIQKLVGQQTGVAFGEVLFTHGWWLELKPKNGPPEGYAATFPKEKWQQTEEQIKALSAGDVVAIKFVTDGERHRILVLEKKPK